MNNAPPPFDQPPVDPPLVQFRIRHLLLVVAGVSALMGLLVSLHGYQRLALLIAVSIVVAHVVATTIGLRLKQSAERRRQWLRARDVEDHDESASRVRRPASSPLRFIPPSPLGAQVTRLSWLPILVAVGAAVGGLLGGVLLTATIGHRVTLAGLLLGAVSTACLGAWFTFVMGGFVGISRHAWRDAVQHSRSKQSEGS